MLSLKEPLVGFFKALGGVFVSIWNLFKIKALDAAIYVTTIFTDLLITLQQVFNDLIRPINALARHLFPKILRPLIPDVIPHFDVDKTESTTQGWINKLKGLRHDAQGDLGGPFPQTNESAMDKLENSADKLERSADKLEKSVDNSADRILELIGDFLEGGSQ